MPPMLDVALDKLAARSPQDVFSCELGSGDGNRHAILQLVTKPVRAAYLIKTRARPHPAAKRLVEQPPIQHDIHALVGRLHLDGIEKAIPILLNVPSDAP